MRSAPIIRLNNGVEMPQIGLGTYQSRPGRETRQAVIAALVAGYRLIDTASMYGNEADVGAAIRALRACRETLRQLGMSYLDLYLIHWPDGGLLEETWLALEHLQAEGLVRAIGVSNYTVSHLEEMLDHALVPPAVNQVEFHPFMYRRELLQWMRDRDIALEAYRPLVRARKLHEPTLVAVARDLDKTVAQVLLRWSLQHGAIVIPKSVHVERIRENLDVFYFALSDAEMARLDGLSEGSGVA